MGLEFERSFLALWAKVREMDDVIGVGFAPKVVDGKLVSPRELVIYKTHKDAAIPTDLEGDVRLPQLTGRRATVKERQQDCLTDYQWVFWGKIDKLNNS